MMINIKNNRFLYRALQIIFLCFVIVLPLQAYADDKSNIPSLDTQENLQKFDRVFNAIDEAKAFVENSTKEKNAQCLKAFGSQEFCKCITNKFPVGITFIGYVNVTALTKEELGYKTLPAEDKKLIDNTRKARDECVKDVFK